MPIEEKVVNRLRQVTSSIKQDGANQVSIITNTAQRQAAIEFAKAAATRPCIVGAGLQQISRDPEIFRALFDILEAQKLLEGEADITLVPRGNELLPQLTAASEARPRPPKLTWNKVEETKPYLSLRFGEDPATES